MDYGGLPEPDRKTDGVVAMMLDATQRFDAPLDEERVFGWHAALFPTGYSGLLKIEVARWRDGSNGPMQVVSGPIGKEKVHYEAPAATRVPLEMNRMFEWFEIEKPLDPVLAAAIAHIWFVSIHPLDDGNGRIGRAIMDMALARADGSSQRFYSMSAQICAERQSYYDVLERAQKRSMDITEWMDWFLGRMDRALDSAEGVLRIVREKQAFWDTHVDDNFNERQIKLINLLYDHAFYGNLTSAKYFKMMKCSLATATRDLQDLLGKGILVHAPGGGRSTSYLLKRSS